MGPLMRCVQPYAQQQETAMHQRAGMYRSSRTSRRKKGCLQQRIVLYWPRQGAIPPSSLQRLVCICLAPATPDLLSVQPCLDGWKGPDMQAWCVPCTAGRGGACHAHASRGCQELNTLAAWICF
jgi:hypothetical protein